MFMVVYFPEPVVGLMKMWIEQFAMLQAVQGQFALALVTPYFDAIKRAQVQSKMRHLHLEVVTNPAIILKHRSHANLGLVHSKRS
jgi:hypothetical protein